MPAKSKFCRHAFPFDCFLIQEISITGLLRNPYFLTGDLIMNLALATIAALLLSLPVSGAAGEYPVAPYPDNVEREEGDKGFSRGFGMTNHSYSFDWFDSHMHLAWSHYPNQLGQDQVDEVMDRWFRPAGVYDSA